MQDIHLNITHTHKNTAFLKQLAHKNKEFFIALHFCPKQHREVIAALVGFYTDCMGLFKRIKEPLAIQMRLTWWRTQFDLEGVSSALPVQVTALKNYPVSKLLEIIENEYLHKDPLYRGKSGFMLYKMIANICGYDEVAHKAGDYGVYYNVPKNSTKHLIPIHKLPFSLRFLRLPIILQQENTNFLHLLYHFVKNFLI